jgi:hypothetical protein
MPLESSVSYWDGLTVWLAAIGALLIAASALTSWRYRSLNSQLIRVQEAAARRQKAATDESIAAANAQVATANLEIARLKTPRTLSPDQQQHMVVTLSPFAGQKFSLAVGGEPEQLNLLADIKMVLLSSRWIQIPPVGFGDISIGDAALSYGTGVIIRFAPSASPAIRNIANGLATALSSEDIASKPEDDPRVADASTLNVLVGSKPIR